MAKEKKKSFVLYNDYAEHISLLSNEEAGRLIKAIFAFTDTGEEPELEGMTRMAFSFIREQLRRDAEKYNEICEKRREAARAYSEKRKHQEVYRTDF